MAQNIALAAVVAASFIIVPSRFVVAQSNDPSMQSSPSGTVSPAPVAGADNALLGPPSLTVGRSVPTADGVGTKTVPAKPCATSARGTDGTTTCIGVPSH